MIEKLRHWTMERSACFGAAVVVLVNPGYLPSVGPAGLRLSPVIHIATNPAPPPPPQPPLVKAEALVPPPAAVKTNAEPAVPLAVANTNAPIHATAPTGADQMISPDMFLQYFHATPTNTKTAPMEFTPPGTTTTATSGGSSATYQQ
jgi:hypothetical protein